jgi:hypothetical protein
LLVCLTQLAYRRVLAHAQAYRDSAKTGLSLNVDFNGPRPIHVITTTAGPGLILRAASQVRAGLLGTFAQVAGCLLGGFWGGGWLRKSEEQLRISQLWPPAKALPQSTPPKTDDVLGVFYLYAINTSVSNAAGFLNL